MKENIVDPGQSTNKLIFLCDYKSKVVKSSKTCDI